LRPGLKLSRSPTYQTLSIQSLTKRPEARSSNHTRWMDRLSTHLREHPWPRASILWWLAWSMMNGGTLAVILRCTSAWWPVAATSW